MTTNSNRFTQLRWLQNVVCISALIGAGLLIALGLVGYGSSDRVWMVAAGFSVLFVVVMFMTFAPLIL